MSTRLAEGWHTPLQCLAPTGPACLIYHTDRMNAELLLICGHRAARLRLSLHVSDMREGRIRERAGQIVNTVRGSRVEFHEACRECVEAVKCSESDQLWQPNA